MHTIPVIDLHADTFMKKMYLKEVPFLGNMYYKDRHDDFHAISKNFHITNEKMRHGNVILQTQSLYIDTLFMRYPLHSAMKMFSLILQEIKDNNKLYLAGKSGVDKHNKTGIVVSIEGLEVIENDLDLLDVFYELGVRIVAPTWNRVTSYTASHYEDYGIFRKGKDLIKKMDELGMIVDVSHMSDKSFYDFVEFSDSPIIASHSNARSVCGHSRNLSDDMIEVIKQKKGVIGLNLCQAFLEPDRTNQTSAFEWLYEQIDYIIDRFGLKVLAWGTDFDGIASLPEPISGPDFYPEFAKYMIGKGYKKSDLEMIFYKNSLNVLNRVYHNLPVVEN
jgi:membrane dipeptidase